MGEYNKISEKILEAQTIWIFASNAKCDAICGALALFYSLKELSKNVNLFLEDVPKEIKFIIPSLDFISYPNKFHILIKDPETEISQVNYQKTQDSLRLSFDIKKGLLKKEGVSFHWGWQQPDLIISLGVEDLEKEKSLNNILKEIKEDVFILNINDTKEPKLSITEIATQVIESMDENLLNEKTSTCLLTGLILSSEDLLKLEGISENLERVVFLIKKGGAWQKIVENLKNYERENYR